MERSSSELTFGTTFSGIAWEEVANIDYHGQKPRAIERWPSSAYNPVEKECKKVPTRIWYSPRDGMQWGFQIPSHAPRGEIAEWFKLDLDPSLQSMANAVRRVQNGKADLGVNKLATDYISALRDHPMHTLKSQRLSGAESVPAEFVVAVPAVWTDLAKSKTTAACELALGLTNADPPIRVVSEPEAAAVYALYNCKNHGLNIGDSFVNCDAGGGTVDLISYTITKLRPILEVEEATPGTGALCGSITLNWRFEEYLREKLGHLPGFGEFLSGAMESFEDKIKHLQDVFEPAILKVIELVKEQIKSTTVPIRAVFLVGGFGSSNYLTERLRGAISDNIQILRPHEAWLAVAYGAVMMGQALSAAELTFVKVAHRRARKHYGIERVDVMSWFIKKGERVSEDKPFLRKYLHTSEVRSGKELVNCFELLVNEKSSEAPMVNDDETKTLCNLHTRFTEIPKHDIPRRIGADGRDHHWINYEIETVYTEISWPHSTLKSQPSSGCFGIRYNQAPNSRQTEVNSRRPPQPILQDEHRECAVCTDTKLTSSFPLIAATRSYKHLIDRICSTCLAQSIHQDLGSRSWDQGIRCPEENYGIHAVNQFHGLDLPPDHPANKDKTHQFYWCPVAECNSGQIHDATRKKTEMMICHKCGWRFCGRHGGIKWHEGMNCAEWDAAEREREKIRKRTRDEEGKSERAVKKLAKSCPGNGCGTPTVKNGG
ncbi:hypothetical protein QBC43DRAFT_370448 [Cladorrhinum sp. PSN259]|nr:hypothetical protein QBC43DRAFT_370448 [Cladorrhinum sp. PSN259]